MRSAGCVINDFADRKFDPFVARTRDRPLASRAISSRQALILFFVLILLAFLLVLPILSPLFLLLAVIALFLAATYPFTKRFFALPQAYLGLAFGFGIPMAYAAVVQQLPNEMWFLLLANVFWTIAYDTEYAMVDREDDLKLGLKTSAITFGVYDVFFVMTSYCISLSFLIAFGVFYGRGLWFFMGLLAAFAIALFHYTLIRKREPQKCFLAFAHNNYFGAAIFVGIVFDLAFG